MKKVLFLFWGAVLMLAGMFPANAMCSLDIDRVVSSSSYFGTRLVKNTDSDGSVVFNHVDDPRMVVSLSFASADPVGDISRSEYVNRLDNFASFLVDKAKSQGRWAEKTVHPYDPVASVVVEETEVDNVGSAMVGHMEALFTPNCILIADFISPSSQSLRSRWVQMAQEIVDLRTKASSVVIPVEWMPEDTSPRGMDAVLAGFIIPLVVVLLISVFLGRYRELDPPSIHTRIVLGVNSLLVFFTLLYQYETYFSVFTNGILSARYLDNVLLLLLVGVLSGLGALTKTHSQRYAQIGLIAACVGGFGLSFVSYLGWTPDQNISMIVGISTIIMGGLGYSAWSATSKSKVGRIK